MNPCPSCGFLVFHEIPGSYDICPICGWEDDDVQLKYPSLRGGANKISLFESQQLVINKIPLSIKVYKGFARESDWRELNEDELKNDNNCPITGLDYFNVAGEAENRKYYWKKG